MIVEPRESSDSSSQLDQSDLSGEEMITLRYREAEYRANGLNIGTVA